MPTDTSARLLTCADDLPLAIERPDADGLDEVVSLSAIRKRAVGLCVAARIDQSMIDSAELALNELATNAVAYGGRPIVVCIAIAGRRLVVAVWDARGDCLPKPVLTKSSANGTCGRGLIIVKELADAVSWLTDGTSKCVRAVFELPTSANPHFLAVRLCCPAPPPDCEEPALAS